MFENSIVKLDIVGGGVNPLYGILWPIEPRGFIRNDESLLLISLSGPLHKVSPNVNIGFYLYIYKYYLYAGRRKALVDVICRMHNAFAYTRLRRKLY